MTVSTTADDGRTRIVAELFEDGSFVVRAQDLETNDSEFVGGEQVVAADGMRVTVPEALLDAASLRGDAEVEFTVDGVVVETCGIG